MAAFRPSFRTLCAIGGTALMLSLASNFAQAAQDVQSISVTQLLGRLNQPWVQLIDVRSQAEYAGSDVRALRGGHLPGALNLHALGQAGIDSLDRRRETIVYGHDAAQAHDQAALLVAQGFRDVKVFEGGWRAWAADFALPASNERYADVEAMRARLDELERRLALDTSQQPAVMAAANQPALR